MPTKPKKPFVVHVNEHKTRNHELWYYDENGKRIRTTAGSRDPNIVAEKQAELQFRLSKGMKPKKAEGEPVAGHVSWDEFRDAYFIYKDFNKDIVSRLQIAEKIVQPKSLAEFTTVESMEKLKKGLLNGVGGRKSFRSPQTVKSTLKAIYAALNWAVRKKGWITSFVEADLSGLEKKDDMKGRPLCGEEFDRMLDACDLVAGAGHGESWKHLLRGAATSGLRMKELMGLSWDIWDTFQPRWPKGALPVLELMSTQKNRKKETIPLCPWLEDLLLETPKKLRTGWVFNPKSLQANYGRPSPERLTAERVGKIVSKIGKAAGVIVDRSDKGEIKYASLHDLRRTFAQNLADSDMPKELVKTLMRHADIRTTERYYQVTNIQREAGAIRDRLRQANRITSPV